MTYYTKIWLKDTGSAKISCGVNFNNKAMNPKFLSLIGVLIISLSLAACSGGEKDKAKDAAKEKPAKEEAVKEPEVKPKAAGETPFDYPTVATSAKTGEYVFTVTAKDLDEAFKAKEKGEGMYVTFYQGKMVTPGEAESVVEIDGTENNIPNSLIIPIAAGQSAEKGQVISGSIFGTMTRGYVKEAGTAPKVIEIDMFQDVETLEAGTFNILKEAFQPGTKIACSDESDDYSLKTVINVSGDKVLSSAWASTVEVVERGKCKAVPIVPELSVGATVWISPVDTLQEGAVTEIDTADGMALVKYEWVDMEEEKFPFGDILTEAP